MPGRTLWNPPRTGIALSSSATFAKRVDIGNGRSMYIECRGTGSPTVLLLSGLLGASDLWHAAGQKPPTVYGSVARSTRVCAYDRPGTLRSDGELSRSDPVPQPTTTQNAVDDLDALLKAADVPGPTSSPRTPMCRPPARWDHFEVSFASGMGPPLRQ